MLSSRTNIHRSKLPRPGALGVIVGLHRHGIDPGRRCIVESFPVTDSADYRYSIGIHTCTVRFLDNGERRRVSGFYFEEN